MKPGDLLEWDETTFELETLDSWDAVSPFVVVELERQDVKVMGSNGKLVEYDIEALKLITRRVE